MAAFLDIALGFDPATRRCDIRLGADGDALMDDTPYSAMILSLGVDRRAEPDDILPSSLSGLNSVTGSDDRRGWCGDALDLFGQRAGSRLWLLDREKQTDATAMRAAAYAREALDWAAAETAAPAETKAEWIARGVLMLTATVDNRPITFRIGG